MFSLLAAGMVGLAIVFILRLYLNIYKVKIVYEN
jgi:hypothetical protein